MNRAWIVSLVIPLAACGGGGEDSAPDAQAMSLAGDIESRVDSVTKTVEITEDNDPNDDIGRPGKYTEAVSIYDERAECDSELDVTCGAKIEVWADEDAAQDRSDYIQGILEEAQILGAEYHYIDGGVLLRVSGQLKPSEAEEYEAAFG